MIEAIGGDGPASPAQEHAETVGQIAYPDRLFTWLYEEDVL
jgi:hypothetical protein